MYYKAAFFKIITIFFFFLFLFFTIAAEWDHLFKYSSSKIGFLNKYFMVSLRFKAFLHSNSESRNHILPLFNSPSSTLWDITAHYPIHIYYNGGKE